MSSFLQALIVTTVGVVLVALLSPFVIRTKQSLNKVPRTTRALMSLQAFAMLVMALFLAMSVTLVGHRADLALGVLLCGLAATELAWLLSLLRAIRVEATRDRLRYQVEARRQSIASGQISGPEGPLGGLVRSLQVIWERLGLGGRR